MNPNEARKTIAVLLYPELTALDLVGPLQVLAELERFAPEYRVVVVGRTTVPADTDVGVTFVPGRTFLDEPHPWAILVPGGRGATIRALSDPVVREYVSQAASTAEYVTSVCTGSLILASVGLLEGRRATTNWAFASVLDRLGGHYVRERWIHDGRLVMSAGVSAGIDMALYLVATLTDQATARRIQQAIDYDPAPPFGPIDWDRLPALGRLARGVIGAAAPWIARKPRRLTRSAGAARLRGAWPSGA